MVLTLVIDLIGQLSRDVIGQTVSSLSLLLKAPNVTAKKLQQTGLKWFYSLSKLNYTTAIGV